MDGHVRLTGRLFAGTRDQLSALHRLAQAEYLQSVVVLEDQLVQGDDMRMDWYHAKSGVIWRMNWFGTDG